MKKQLCVIYTNVIIFQIDYVPTYYLNKNKPR